MQNFNCQVLLGDRAENRLRMSVSCSEPLGGCTFAIKLLLQGYFSESIQGWNCCVPKIFCTPATGRFVAKVLSLSVLPTSSLQRKTSQLFKFSKMPPTVVLLWLPCVSTWKFRTRADVFQLCPQFWVGFYCILFTSLSSWYVIKLLLHGFLLVQTIRKNYDNSCGFTSWSSI